MEIKLLELRDRGTFIPVIAVNCDGSADLREEWLLGRAGYALDGQPTILLTRLGGDGRARCGACCWCDRTFASAHNYITNNWSRLESGDVVDVEFVLGETTAPKMSERNPEGIMSIQPKE